jgi:hypothetical protein
MRPVKMPETLSGDNRSCSTPGTLYASAIPPAAQGTCTISSDPPRIASRTSDSGTSEAKKSPSPDSRRSRAAAEPTASYSIATLGATVLYCSTQARRRGST